MYERQDGSGLEVGSYAHRPILYDPEDIPSVEEAALSPTEFPFTQDDFALQMEHALELMPEIVGDESVGIKYAINGLLSLTPDGLPVLGETPEVDGPLVGRAAVWVKEGPGVGRALAEWMVEGEPEIDLQASDVARFHEHQKSVAHVKARASEHFNKTYGIVHPGRAVGVGAAACGCPPSTSARATSAPSSTRPPAGSARTGTSRTPGCVEEYGVERPRGGVGRALVVADHQRRAPRDARPRGDVRPHRLLRVRRGRPGRARVRAARGDAPDGREGRQGRLHAGAHAARRLPLRPHDHAARPTSTSAWSPAARTGWPTSSGSATTLVEDGTAQVVDLTSSWCTLGLWGPRARDILASTTGDDVSHEGFPFATLPHDRDGLAARAGVADLLRRRPRLGALRADRAGREALGHGLGGGRAARRPARRDRRLRHHRPAREVLPGLRLRARRRVRRGRGGHGLGQGQGARTSSARRRTCASARRTRRR